MAFNFMIEDPMKLPNTQSTTINTPSINVAGIGSWCAVAFMAKENLTINRLAMGFGSGGAGLAALVGIGTIDINTGQPTYALSGTGDSLAFSSVVEIGGSVSGNRFFTIPEISLTAGTKYFVGYQTIITGNTMFFIFRIGNNSLNDTSNYRVFQRSSAGISFGYSSNPSLFNWGYDSGSGGTRWYNEFYQGNSIIQYNLSSTGSSQVGFTYYMNNDFDAMELENFSIYITNPNSTYGNGLGTTYNFVLYDSDGITALTASTSCSFGSGINAYKYVNIPVKYTLQNRKEYFFAFNRESTNPSALWAAIAYDNQFQAGTPFTTYTFTKESPSSEPVKNMNEQFCMNMKFSKAYGSRQGGQGLH